ncbi:MAG: hypothetical protein GY803_26735, partial [Chloroflexi bacterium]|nr:hypothetical protein [Chloroflexota bacterium]
GDVINISYAFTLPRELGKDAASGTSQRRIQRQFTVSAIVRHNGVTGVGSGMFVELSELQTWLNLPGQAKQMVVMVDPKLYETNNTDVAVLQVRDVARSIQRQLGEEYQFSLAKASVLADVAQAFLAFQALINTYGLISLGVVGLLVYTLVLTNVQEQRRDMAVLRILGGQRNLLYRLVIV